MKRLPKFLLLLAATALVTAAAADASYATSSKGNKGKGPATAQKPKTADPRKLLPETPDLRQTIKDSSFPPLKGVGFPAQCL